MLQTSTFPSFSALVFGAIRVPHIVHRILAANEATLLRLQTIGEGSGAAAPSDSVEVLGAFNDSMNQLRLELDMLIVQGTNCAQQLRDLESNLHALHRTISRGSYEAHTDYAILSSKLWTRLGFNSQELRVLETKLQTLAQLLNYRNQALSHVSKSLIIVRDRKIDMEMLQEKVSQPLPMGQHLSVEQQTKTVVAGIQELKRSKALFRQRDGVETLSIAD